MTTQKAYADGLGLIEAKLAQMENVEQRAEFGPNLLLADDRWPRIMRFARVAGQHQGQCPWAGQTANRP
jgi:hypothetical protein